MKHSRLFLIILVLFGSFFFSCCVHEKNTGTSKTETETVVNKSLPQVYGFDSPVAGQTFISGDKIPVRLKKLSSETIKADSFAFFIDGIAVADDPGNESGFLIDTKSLSPGIKRLKFTAWFPGRTEEYGSVPVRILSDIKPLQYTFKIIGSFPHDKNAYTQGFEYHDGYFYEGTGQYGQSSLRKITPGTGDIIKSRTISSDLFGEGITLLNGKIYQITWQSQVGFVYDAENFEQIQKFYFQNREGWGLCNNGSEIIMSDGTNIIYFIDPQYFSVVRKIEVCDNVSEVDSLNELEFFNGLIYANRYMTDEIVMIDPANGKVAGKVSLKGLLRKEDRHPDINVLNGIAWDEQGKRLFLTGKNWPKIYQVEILPK